MIRVLVIDDSLLIRTLLKQIIEQALDIEVIGMASDAFVGRDMVNSLKPDVITLDIEMPKVDGLTFLDRLMKAKPTPVVMISALTQKGATATIKALELGAVDFISKPSKGAETNLVEYTKEIHQKIRIAAEAKPRSKIVEKVTQTPATEPIRLKGPQRILGMGASTGGTEAIRTILEQLPATFPATVITQHMPKAFTASFANRLNSVCKMSVKEAEHGERLLEGNVYIAPGDRHLTLTQNGTDYRIMLSDGPLVCGHKPSVDVMFHSIAKVVKNHAIAALLTGMGKDGAQGMLAMKSAGATTFAQDEASCVVFGMPKSAYILGGVDEIVSLEKMAFSLIQAIQY